MPTNLLDDHLNQVLDSFHRDRLPPIVREALLNLPQHIIHCLQDCPSVSSHLSEPAFQSGPFARQTDINVGLEMEVTVPVIGLRAQEVGEFRQTVADCLRQSIARKEASIDQIKEVIHLNFLSGPWTVLVKVYSIRKTTQLHLIKRHLGALQATDTQTRQSIRLLKIWAHCREIKVSSTKLERLLLSVSTRGDSTRKVLVKIRWPCLPEGFVPLRKALQNKNLPFLRKELILQP